MQKFSAALLNGMTPGSTYYFGSYNYVSISTMCPNTTIVEKSDVMVDFAQTVTGI